MYQRENVPAHLAAVGRRFYDGLTRIAAASGGVIESVRGIPEFCYLQCAGDATSTRLAAECASRGLLFKRNAYNFMCLAHTDEIVDQVLQGVGDVVEALRPGAA